MHGIDAIGEQSRKDRAEFKKWAESLLAKKLYFDDSDRRSKGRASAEEKRHEELLQEMHARLEQLFKLLAQIP